MGQILSLRRNLILLIALLAIIAGCDTSSISIRIDTLDVTSLNFGQIHVHDSKELSFEVYCRSKNPVHIEKIEMQNGIDYSIVKVLDNSDSPIVSPYSIELNKDEKITVYVVFAPLTMGNLYDDVLIFHDAKNKSNPLVINCEGEGLTPLTPEIKVTPPNMVDFGNAKMRMNQIYEDIVEVENIGSYDLEIKEIALDTGIEFSIYEVKDFNGNSLLAPFSSYIKAGEKVTIIIRFNPLEVKTFTDKLKIKHNATNEISPYVVNLTGEGIAPTISVKDTKLLSSNGELRATGYVMGNRVITGSGKIFAAWSDSTPAIKIASYDIASNTWGNSVTVGYLPASTDGPSITMDSSGYIYIIYGPVNGQFISTRTVAPYDISTWQRTRSFGTNVQYASLVCDKTDTVHCSYYSITNPTKLMFQTYVNGNSWSNPIELIQFNSTSTKTQYAGSLAVSSNGDLNLSFYVYGYNGVSAGTYVGFIRSKDSGKTWENVDGTPMSLPISTSSNCFIEQGSNLDMRIGNMAIDDNGNPWVTITHLESTPTIKLAHHNGNSWQIIDLLPELQKYEPNKYLSMATLTFDNAGMLYVTASMLSPGYITWYGDNSLEVVLFASADYGKTFQFLQVSQTDPNLANWLACIERPYGPNPIDTPGLLFSHGSKSVYPVEVIFKSFQKQ